jgi:hypothetical protein
MAETLTKSPGTAPASPEHEKPKWMTEEDAEKYEKLLHRQFIRKGDKENAAKFFYKPESIVAYQPGGIIASEEDQMYKFLVQKYHRGKTAKATVRISEKQTEEIDSPVPVEGHVMSQKRGLWKCVDPDANFFIPVTEFKEKFEADNVE